MSERPPNPIPSQVTRGEFPYRLTDGATESPYLTWLRNHSNYMVSRGFLDYFRAVGVLVRGIVLNFLIVMSMLLVVSLLVGYLYHSNLRSSTISTADFVKTVELALQLQDAIEFEKEIESETDTIKPESPLMLLIEAIKSEKDIKPKKDINSAKAIEQKVIDNFKKRDDKYEPPRMIDRWLVGKLSIETKVELEKTVKAQNTIQKLNESADRKPKDQASPQNDNPAKVSTVEKQREGKKDPLIEAIEKLEESESLLERLLVSDLCELISNRFDPRTFPNDEELESTPKVLELLKEQPPKGVRLRQRNRRILEEAYPDHLPKDQHNRVSFQDWVASPIMPQPYFLTLSVSGIALAWVLLFPIGLRFRQISHQRESVLTGGGDSSVKVRDLWERTFGAVLLAIFVTAVFESLPLLTYRFHLIQEFRATLSKDADWWNTLMALTGGTSVAVLSGAGKLLSVLGGTKKKLATLFIGLLSLLVPLLVVLYVTDFLVYEEAYQGELNLGLLALPAGFILLTIAAFLWGLVKGSFSWKEIGLLILLFLGLTFGTLALAGFLLVRVSLADDFASEWNYYFVIGWALQLWLFCFLFVDVNRTSIHGLYRDRLASAYLMGLDTGGDVVIAPDLNLGELCCHDTGSTAPYHLVNVALNLQGSDDPSIRDRKSDFFIFSKRFVGGHRTGYCRSETLEQVHPQMNLATAMAISAAAASPNMGTGTNPLLVWFMVLLNVRLGYWLPNPGLLEDRLSGKSSCWKDFKRCVRRLVPFLPKLKEGPPGLCFENEVFQQELKEVQRRWQNAYPNASERFTGAMNSAPTTAYGLVGIGFSGGGIRSATINLGIAQVLDRAGVFSHVDFMSTVSGGGYLGSSISTLMRRGNVPATSEIAGVVQISADATQQIVTVADKKNAGSREYRYAKDVTLAVKEGCQIKAGGALVACLPPVEQQNSLLSRFLWRIRPWALLREMEMKLDETYSWVNLSDGGHIENLAGIELLRRRCKFIILGDGEADPNLWFNGLATLIRYARIDMGIDIQINPKQISVNKSKHAVDKGKDNQSQQHFAFGTITYPGDAQPGYLLYLKSSFTGDEDEVIQEYRHRNPDFPHQSTADQMFEEDQFECYRSLGQHIGEKAVAALSSHSPTAAQPPLVRYKDFTDQFAKMAIAAAQEVECEEEASKAETSHK